MRNQNKIEVEEYLLDVEEQIDYPDCHCVDDAAFLVIQMKRRGEVVAQQGL